MEPKMKRAPVTLDMLRATISEKYAALAALGRIKTYCNSSNGYPYNAYSQSSTEINKDLDIIEKTLQLLPEHMGE